MKVTSFTVYTDLTHKYGLQKGAVLSVLVNLTLSNNAFGGTNWIRVSGPRLSMVTGLPAATCTKIINQLADDGLIVKKSQPDKTYSLILNDYNLFPFIHESSEIAKHKKTQKSEEEKKIIRMAHAIYKERLDLEPEYAGNKHGFLTAFKKLKLPEAERFAIAFNNYADYVRDQKPDFVYGLKTFLENDIWKKWMRRIPTSRLELIKRSIPKNKEGQYITVSEEYKRYIQLLEMKNAGNK